MNYIGRKVVVKIVRIAGEELNVGRNTAERGKAARTWFVFAYVVDLTTYSSYDDC